MKIEKVYASIDAANMKDLLQTFAAKNIMVSPNTKRW